MRLAQFLLGSQEGGAEEFFLKLALALSDEGISQHLIISPNERRESILHDAHIPHTTINFEGPLNDLKGRRVLTRTLKTFAPHVLLSWMNRASRRVKSSSDYVTIGRQGGYYKTKNYSGCDYLIGNTPAVVDFIVGDGWPADRARLISNFGDVSPSPAVSRADFETPDGSTILLALGRFHAMKAFDTLIAALPHLPPHYILWLAGDGNGHDRSTLEAQAHALGISERIRFLGWRTDIFGLMQAADMLVCSSRDEPLGNVILEAWQMGLPAVATDSRGPKWLITHGRDGLLSPVDDSAALSTQILRLGSDESLRQELSRNAQNTYQERFSKPAIVRQFTNFFHETYESKFGSSPDS